VAVVVVDPLEEREEYAPVGGEVGIDGEVKNAELRHGRDGSRPGEWVGQDALLGIALLVKDPYCAG
jgi:hypothetical protein